MGDTPVFQFVIGKERRASLSIAHRFVMCLRHAYEKTFPLFLRSDKHYLEMKDDMTNLNPRVSRPPSSLLDAESIQHRPNLGK